MAIKAVAGKLPVNLIVVAEGDEERMSIGLRQFVQDASRAVQGRRSAVARRRPELLRPQRHQRRQLRRVRLHRADDERREVGPRADRVRHPRRQQAQRRQPGVAPHQDAGVAHLRRRQHGIKVDGFYDDAVQPTQGAVGDRGASRPKFIDMEEAAKNLGVARFMADDPVQLHARPQLDLVQPGRHLGREHVCGRRRRDPAEQDHVEAQHPLRAEHDRARTWSRRSRSSSSRTAIPTSTSR